MERISMRRDKNKAEEERMRQEQEEALQNKLSYDQSSSQESDSRHEEHEEDQEAEEESKQHVQSPHSNYKSEPDYGGSTAQYASTAANSSIKKSQQYLTNTSSIKKDQRPSQSIQALEEEENDDVNELGFYKQNRSNSNTNVKEESHEGSEEQNEEQDEEADHEERNQAYDTNEEVEVDMEGMDQADEEDMDGDGDGEEQEEAVDLDNLDRGSKVMSRSSQQSGSTAGGQIYDVDDDHNINVGGMLADDNSPLQKRRSIIEQTHDLRALLNKIFAMRGGWRVKNLAQDFSDGFLFQELFNILYDEKIDCCLTGNKDGPNPNLPYETRVLNWNKINAGICFNYFQQQFFFVQGTMMTLARGKSGVLTAQAIRELLIAMQGTHHNTFDDAVDVKDIADLLRINI